MFSEFRNHILLTLLPKPATRNNEGMIEGNETALAAGGVVRAQRVGIGISDKMSPISIDN